MSRSSRARSLAASSLALACAAAAAADYGLGRAATPAEIAAWDIDVRPDGAGLPKGHGSVEQGQAVYDAQCAACHGTFGESTDYMQLAGGAGSLRSSAPVRTVGSLLDHATTLFDYIYRAMPFSNSKSLSWDETYAVTAYVLHLNDILPADAVLDEKSLPLVPMPNRGGFTTQHGLMSVKGQPDVHNTACMHDCETAVEITSQLPAGFVERLYGDLSVDFRGLAAPPAAPPSTGQQFAASQPCLVCHAVDHRIVGPAFREVAEKYKGAASAQEMLVGKLKSGSVGVWGTVPMPPQPQLSDDEAQTLVRWILSGAPNSPAT